MADTATIDETINFAQKVLDAKPGRACNVRHQFNYFSKKANLKAASSEKKMPPQQVVYTAPGQARGLELKLPLADSRAGAIPQHNSPGNFSEDLVILPSLTLDEYSNLHSIESLLDAGYQRETAVLTKKKINKIADQFSNLSTECFQGMMCLTMGDDKRDFEIWVKHGEETVIAYLNPENDLIQFIQTVTRNHLNEIVDLKHVVFETGMPIVINQSTFDRAGNLRNIAHVGVTGSTANSFVNSLERFDDGTVVWTSSDYKNSKAHTGSAALKEDGEVILLRTGDKRMAEFSARNLGAEGIHPRTLSWTGKYAADACVKEEDDKYIVRREYKNAVRKQVYQIVDGACIPGPDPIFEV